MSKSRNQQKQVLRFSYPLLFKLESRTFPNHFGRDRLKGHHLTMTLDPHGAIGHWRLLWPPAHHLLSQANAVIICCICCICCMGEELLHFSAKIVPKGHLFWEPCLRWFLVRIPSDGVQRWETPLCLAKGNRSKMHNSPAIDTQTDTS